MATPTASISGIVRYRSAFLQFIYTDGGSYWPYGGIIDWWINGELYGQTTYDAYAEACNGINVIGLTPGTIYTVKIYAFPYDATGGLTFLGELETSITTKSRPSAFSWTVPKTTGEQYYIGATEWALLLNNVVNVLEYTGYTYTFSQELPSVGELVTADRYNDIRAAIQSIPGYGAYIPLVAAGDIVTAYQLNVLVSELNAVP